MKSLFITAVEAVVDGKVKTNSTKDITNICSEFVNMYKHCNKNWIKVLAKYASVGDLYKIQLLLEQYKNIRITTKCFRKAYENGWTDLAEYLFNNTKHNIDINKEQRGIVCLKEECNKALLYAVKNGNLGFVKFLLKNGAKVNERIINVSFKRKDNHDNGFEIIKCILDGYGIEEVLNLPTTTTTTTTNLDEEEETKSILKKWQKVIYISPSLEIMNYIKSFNPLLHFPPSLDYLYPITVHYDFNVIKAFPIAVYEDFFKTVVMRCSDTSVLQCIKENNIDVQYFIDNNLSLGVDATRYYFNERGVSEEILWKLANDTATFRTVKYFLDERNFDVRKDYNYALRKNAFLLQGGSSTVLTRGKKDFIKFLVKRGADPKAVTIPKILELYWTSGRYLAENGATVLPPYQNPPEPTLELLTTTFVVVPEPESS
jgi:hypothetical protein